MPAKKQTDNYNKTQEKIILAAREIIKTDGFNSLSVRKLAKKVNLAPSVIYHYFDNIDMIKTETYKLGAIDIKKAIDNVQDKKASFKENIYNSFKAVLLFARENHNEYVTLVSGVLFELNDVSTAPRDFLRHQIEQAMDSGEIKKQDSFKLTFLIWISFQSLNLKLVQMKNLSKAEMVEYYDTYFNMIFEGIENQKEK